MFSVQQAPAASTQREEISRVVRLSRLACVAEPHWGDRVLRRLDTGAACAVVVLASSSVLCAAVWLLERWQLH
jgi:hypothetical protein